MATWDLWWYATFALLPFVAIGSAVLYAGFLAYQARMARERRDREPRPVMPDAPTELQRINAEIVASLAEARATLERTRETFRKGIKG